MLQELLEQDQFELVFREKQEKADKDIRLVYLMNDAVESFLVFKNARMTGEYRKDYEGELEASISHNGKEYILIVRQGNSVVTLFFDDIFPEVHLYDYGEIGHFWVQGYEYLRQLEYRIAILRDKLYYLGEEFCTPKERELAALSEFPPLNYCCYPAVPNQYIVPREDGWRPSEEAITVMEELAGKVNDKRMKLIATLFKIDNLYDYIDIEFKHVGPDNQDNYLLIFDIADRIQMAIAFKKFIKHLFIYILLFGLGILGYFIFA